MREVVGTQEYVRRLLVAPRPGKEKVLSFYEHRIGVICKDPKLLLIPLDDHLVHRGDGVFETLKFINNRIYLLDRHIKRMENSCLKIGLKPPCSWAEVKDIVKDVARASGESKGVISVFIGRGCGGFSIDPEECKEPSLYVVCRRFPEYPDSMWSKGVSACRVSIPAKQSYMSQIKSVNYLPNVLMKMEAKARGCDYPVCFTEEGFLAEGATENICVVKNNKVFVPELSNILPGTTLLRALELINVEYEFCPLREEDLYEAEEVILLGTTIDALSVVKYNGSTIGKGVPGNISITIRKLLVEDQIKKENLLN